MFAGLSILFASTCSFASFLFFFRIFSIAINVSCVEDCVCMTPLILFTYAAVNIPLFTPWFAFSFVRSPSLHRTVSDQICKLCVCTLRIKPQRCFFSSFHFAGDRYIRKKLNNIIAAVLCVVSSNQHYSNHIENLTDSLKHFYVRYLHLCRSFFWHFRQNIFKFSTNFLK